jgi:hypothetical protein
MIDQPSPPIQPKKICSMDNWLPMSTQLDRVGQQFGSLEEYSPATDQNDEEGSNDCDLRASEFFPFQISSRSFFLFFAFH